MSEAEDLASSRRGVMVAPAGCGKTHVVAAAVRASAPGRYLVLTHTHAGVEALRDKLRTLGVATSKYEVETIAGWTLRLAASFPVTSGASNFAPRDGAGYRAIYGGADRLLGLEPIKEIVQASYTGVFVDEYQDCTVDQHSVVLGLLNVLPCKVVGDPLQGIFDFGENHPVQWDSHVSQVFDAVDGPRVPWRWCRTNPALGEWLLDARARLAVGNALDLDGAPVMWRESGDFATGLTGRVQACHAASANADESVIAIHKWSRQGHSVAKRLSGRFTCIEPIDSADLYEYAERLSSRRGYERALAVLDFAAVCMTKVNEAFGTLRRAFEQRRIPRVRSHAAAAARLSAVIEDESLTSVEQALIALEREREGVVFRRELLCEMKRALRAVSAGEASTLVAAACVVRNRARRVGRSVSRCSVGTTLLVKGLEFDHAIVLDGDEFDSRNLYVAITRGARSLTIISKSKKIMPTAGSTEDGTRPQQDEGQTL